MDGGGGDAGRVEAGPRPPGGLLVGDGAGAVGVDRIQRGRHLGPGGQRVERRRPGDHGAVRPRAPPVAVPAAEAVPVAGGGGVGDHHVPQRGDLAGLGGIEAQGPAPQLGHGRAAGHLREVDHHVDRRVVPPLAHQAPGGHEHPHGAALHGRLRRRQPPGRAPSRPVAGEAHGAGDLAPLGRHPAPGPGGDVDGGAGGAGGSGTHPRAASGDGHDAPLGDLGAGAQGGEDAGGGPGVLAQHPPGRRRRGGGPVALDDDQGPQPVTPPGPSAASTSAAAGPLAEERAHTRSATERPQPTPAVVNDTP